MVPLRARECKHLLLGIELPFYTQQHVWNLAFVIRKRTKKHGVYFRKSGNLCGTLLGRNESPSVYPHWWIGSFESNPPILHLSKTSQCDVIIIAKAWLVH